MARMYAVNHSHQLKKAIKMKNQRYTLPGVCIVLLFLSLIGNSCMENSITVPSDIVFPDSNVSYVNHVEPLMKFTCAAGGCHNAFDYKAGLALDTHYGLTTAWSGAMVIPGKPEQSVLIQILERKVPHSLIIDFRINDNQLNGLKTWIKEGTRM